MPRSSSASQTSISERSTRVRAESTTASAGASGGFSVASLISSVASLAAPLLATVTLALSPLAAPALIFAAPLGLWLSADAAEAQDWGDDPDDSWSQPSYETPAPSARSFDRGSAADNGWSGRVGLGFTAEPTTLLLNFELPYAFDRWVSVGPMLQVGIEDDETIVAPTMNLTVSIPDTGIAGLERVSPYGFVGIGFAVIEDDDRRNDNSATGFLINFGVGLEYQVSERLFLGSHMTFNFLPQEALSQEFFYSWQVGGARIAF